MRFQGALIASVLPVMIILLWHSANAAPVAAQGASEIFWVPRGVSTAELSRASETYFEGLSGLVVGTAPANAPALTAAGGRALPLLRGETLYAYAVQEAERADFEAPSRVLLRAGHEVFVATPGGAPRLTEASDRPLAGLKQPVRIGLVPRRPYPEHPPLLPTASRTEDPLVREMVNQVTEESFATTWQTLEDFETRETYQPNNLAASQWILDTFHSYGLRAEFHYYEQLGPKRNVIATLPGLVDSAKVVYICGHFDSTSPTPEICAPGADDNGSGVNAVLEAARILRQYSFEYTVKFACFNGEEHGLSGSTAYTSDIADADEDVIGAYNCDMIAFRGLDPAPADLVIYTNAFSSELATVLSSAILTYTNEIEPVVVVENMVYSDHASFWSQGFRALCSIEDEAWGTDFCPWYHTCYDRIVNYPVDYAVACTKANLAAVAITAVPIYQASNAGGTLIVHDTGLAYSSDTTAPPPSPVPACSGVDNQALLDVWRIWKVYAAFPDSPGPRLKEVWWGAYPSTNGGGGIAIQGWGLPDPSGDVQVVTAGWPGTPGSGVNQVFGETKTSPVIECYWFGGYAYAGGGGEAQTFATGPHPVEGGLFVDDRIQAQEEPVAGYGSLGFGQAGSTPCPSGATFGACCSANATCMIKLQSECAPPATWHGEWGSCAPNPCSTTAVETTRHLGGPGLQALPNPSTGRIALRVVETHPGGITIRIFDPSGRLIRTVWDGVVNSGAITAVWDGRYDSGRSAPAGVYLVKVTSPAGETSRQVVLTR